MSAPITGEIVGHSPAVVQPSGRVAAPYRPGPQQVPNLVAAWLIAQSSPNTASAYRGDITLWLDWCKQSGVEPLEIVRANADAWARWMEHNDHGRYKRPASRATVNRRLASVSSFYDYCVHESVIDVNRVKSVKRHRMAKGHSETFTPSLKEAQRILAEAQDAGPRVWAFTTLMTFTGVRVTEAMSADVRDLRTVRGDQHLRVVRKGGEAEHIPLKPAGIVGAALAEYLDGRKTGPLFLGRHGERLTRQAASNEIAAVGKAAGCPDLTPHGLRHLFATLATLTGTKKDDLQKFMGHSDGRTTDIYIALNDHYDRHPGDEIAALLGLTS